VTGTGRLGSVRVAAALIIVPDHDDRDDDCEDGEEEEEEEEEEQEKEGEGEELWSTTNSKRQAIPVRAFPAWQGKQDSPTTPTGNGGVYSAQALDKRINAQSVAAVRLTTATAAVLSRGGDGPWHRRHSRLTQECLRCCTLPPPLSPQPLTEIAAVQMQSWSCCCSFHPYHHPYHHHIGYQ
jgi:hypothetical protein